MLTIYRLTLAVLTTTVLLTLTSQFGRFYLLELTTHFRLQYVLVALVCAVVLAGFQSWKFVVIAVLCAVLNSVYLVPYYRHQAQPSDDPQSVKLRMLHANVMNNNTSHDAMVQVIQDAKADVIVVQEFTLRWGEKLKILQSNYPHSTSEPRRDGGGVAIFSKYPLEETKILQLDESTHIAMFARVNRDGRSIAILAIHPTTPISRRKFVNRNRQFKEAAEVLSKIDGPKVLIGDFNSTMWSPYFAVLQQSAGMRDCRLGFGLNPTWPVILPPFLRLPIDHCLVSSQIKVHGVQLGNAAGSDHRPLIVDLSF